MNNAIKNKFPKNHQKWRKKFIVKRLCLGVKVWLGIKVDYQPTQLRSLLKCILTDLHPVIEQEKGVIINMVRRELPVVKIDRLQISRVYHHLITNALKYNEPGVNIILDAWVAENYLHCIVADNGVGISEQKAENLYMCQRTIKAHGGFMGMQSSSEEGATFWFLLPIKVGG